MEVTDTTPRGTRFWGDFWGKQQPQIFLMQRWWWFLLLLRWVLNDRFDDPSFDFDLSLSPSPSKGKVKVME